MLVVHGGGRVALSGGSEWWLVVALSGGSRPMVVVRGGGKGLLSGGSWWLVVAWLLVF